MFCCSDVTLKLFFLYDLSQYFKDLGYEYCLQQDEIPSSNNIMEPHRSSFLF